MSGSHESGHVPTPRRGLLALWLTPLLLAALLLPAYAFGAAGVGGPGGPPVNVTPPAISGDPTAGKTLTCLPGEWTETPGFIYQWNRDGTPIAGATGPTYVVTAADTGHQLTCTVQASNGSGTATLTSAGVLARSSSSSSPSSATCQGRAATIIGTAGPDKLKGTKGPDVIVALGGKDKVKAKGGKDFVCAGGGKDKVMGGAGKDRLKGQGGADRLLGGGGKDKLKGGRGRDTLVGGPAKDKLAGGPGKNVLKP